MNKQRRDAITAYRRACKLVRSIEMDVVDGLALTYSCAHYPAWIRDMNGWAVEDAAERIAKQRDAELAF